MRKVYPAVSTGECREVSSVVWSAESYRQKFCHRRPPPAVARGPVRVGGAITAPALVSRVEPIYPRLAVSANVQGVVILEAVVDREGHVESVEVLRSIPLLDDAAIAAVRQWRYSPLLLNGRPERFVLTVTVGFSLNT